MKKRQSSPFIYCCDRLKSTSLVLCKLLFALLATGIVTNSSCLSGRSDVKIVKNDQLKLVFVTRPVPFLRELVQKSSGVNLLAEPAEQNFFTIETGQVEGMNLTIESQSAVHGTLKVVRNRKSQHILIDYSGLGPSKDMTVHITGILEDGESTVKWSFTLENPGLQKISTVRFPYISAVPAIGSPDDDFIVAPSFPGVLIENPANNWEEKYSAAWTFPGQQSAQFISYQDQEAGIYLAGMDTTGYGRALRITREGDHRFILTQEFKLPEKPEVRWDAPYDVVFGITRGTWQQTADIYKKWAVKQPWCSKTLVQRDDIPGWWKNAPCIHTYYMRSKGSAYPRLLQHLKSLRTRIGGPVVPRLGSWENYRSWTAGAYFPVFDEQRAREVLPQVREEGFLPFVFLSGLYYTFNNEGPEGSLVPGSENHTASFVLNNEGKLRVDVLGDNRTDGWNRYSYCFCPFVPDTKIFFRSVIDQLHSLGIDLVQMDQATSGAGPACYNPSHGHMVGSGPYQSESFRELLNDMRLYGKSLTPDFLLLNEELHEELIPCLDAFHTREYCENFWFRGTPGARGIPLFTYLYHEYAMAYGGEGTGVSTDKNPNLVRDHVINLVTGKMPTVGTQMDMADAHPDQVRVLQNHINLLKTEAQRFLILGRMLHPLQFDVPTVTFKMGGKWHPKPVTERAVLTSSWQSPEGLVGHCLVNVTDTIRKVSLQLDTRNAPGWPASDVDLYHAGKPDLCENIWHSVTLPHKYEVELEPYEALFFVVRPSK